MKKTIGELTLNEITKMKCNPEGCSKCPFNSDDNRIGELGWDLCDLVNRNDDNGILEQEIEVDEK